MHEFFLISDCDDEELLKATKLLQGYCEMAPVSLINRRLIWEAPHVPKQKGFDPQFLMRQPQQKLPLWKALQDAVTRQAYFVNLVYGVPREDFGRKDVSDGGEEKKISLDEMPGSLYWADWPDPKSARLVSSRAAAAIDNEKELCSLLKSMGYHFKTELVEEGYQFIHGNVIIYIHRYLEVPSILQKSVNGQEPNFSTVLPSYESLTPLDSSCKWIVKARVDVLNVGDHGQVQKGIDDLHSVRDAFEGVFEFQVPDRRMLDTRVRL